MKRVDFLKEALEINHIQAEILSELLDDIPNNKLKNFLVFRMDYIQPMMSKELITKNALFDYKKKMIEERLRSGEEVFKNIYEVKEYLLTFYKGKEIANGAGNFYDYAVIGMDKDGELINKFAQNEHGTFKKLSSAETGCVLSWCFKNQHRIGLVEYVAYYDPDKVKQIDHTQASKLIELVEKQPTDNKVSLMVKKLAQKVSA